MRLAESGFKELNIIAQDTTAYGWDLEPRSSLELLLRDLIQLDIPWIRVLYTYPAALNDSLLDLMARHESLLHYVDLPLQHAADSVLQRCGGRAVLTATCS